MRRFDLLDEYACCIPRYSHPRANGSASYREAGLESHAGVSDGGLDRPRHQAIYDRCRIVIRRMFHADGLRGRRAASA